MSSPRYKAYVVQNPELRYYIGLSDDVERLVRDHNSGVSTWTRARGPWQLRWTSEAMSLSEAKKLENFLKRQKGGNGFFAYTGLSRIGS